MQSREPASARKLQRAIDALDGTRVRRANPPPRLNYDSIETTDQLLSAVMAADRTHGDTMAARAAVACARDVVRESDGRGLIDTDILEPLLSVAEDAVEDALSYDQFGRRIGDILAVYDAPRRFGSGDEYDREGVRGAVLWAWKGLATWATESPSDGRSERVAISNVVIGAVRSAGAALTRDIADGQVVGDAFLACRLAWVALGYTSAASANRVLALAVREISTPKPWDVVGVVVGRVMDDAEASRDVVSSFISPWRILRDSCEALVNGLVASLGGSDDARKDVAREWVIREARKTHREYQYDWVASRYARACVSVLRARGMEDRGEDVVIQATLGGLLSYIRDLVREGANESVGGGGNAPFITQRYNDKFTAINGTSLAVAWFNYAVSMAQRNESPKSPSSFGREVIAAARSAPSARAFAKSIGVKSVPPWRPSRSSKARS